MTAIIGKSNTPENFATWARPKTRQDEAATQHRESCRCHHQTVTPARKKKAMQQSEVTRAPWARNRGLNAKKASDTSPPGTPNKRCDQPKTSMPVATLNSAIIARPAIKRGK